MCMLKVKVHRESEDLLYTTAREGCLPLNQSQFKALAQGEGDKSPFEVDIFLGQHCWLARELIGICIAGIQPPFFPLSVVGVCA
mmetsp:Transcript_27733/g.60654  ORF Transcript_27733/g.60654 Transcript_27733/m.60654 type:complete len:84 (+) Transcript_27733:166-417(+)